MKKVTSTLTTLLLCLYVSAQVGALDPNFNSGATGTPGYSTVRLYNQGKDHGQAIATHSDGRIVVAAWNTDKWFTLLRYKLNGTPDSSFGTNGISKVRFVSNADALAYALYIYPNNTILVAGMTWNQAGGTGYDFALTRLLEDGTVDGSFGTGGWTVTPIGTGAVTDEAHSLAVQADGKIVLAGFGNMGANGNDFAVVRYSSNGILETGGGAFGGGTGKVTTHINANDKATSIAIQAADQKIVVGGTSNEGTSGANFAVVRYNTDGSLDATPGNFGTGGIADLDLGNNGAGSRDDGYTLVIQPADGKIVMTGMSKAVGATNYDVATIRLTTSGGLDATFNATGAIVNRAGSFTSAGIAVFNNGNAVSNTDEGARTIALQSDGKILVGGDAQNSATLFDFLLLRYNANGTLDNNFSGDGVATVTVVAGEDNGGFAMRLYNNRIYFTGATTQPGETTWDFLLAAIENDGTPLPLVLSHFYAQKQTSKVVLQWQTTSEEGVKQFVIERSNDGKTYKAIGQVAATGNSTTKKNYNFADQSPFASTNNYYRLLMQDVDGNFKYSKILIVKFDGQLSTNMQVFPSTVNDLLQVQLPNGLNGNVTLQIIDMNGRVIKRNSLASDGNGLNTTMDVSNLVKGVYILKAQAGNTSLISRFTKQ